jgi:type IV secretory pathway VirB4 component
MDDFTKKYLQVKDLEEDIDLFSKLSNLAVIGKDSTKNTLISLSLIRDLRDKGMLVTVIETGNEGNYYERLCLNLGGEYQKLIDGLSQSANPLLVLNIGKSIDIDFEENMDLCPICNILRERIDLGISTENLRGYLVIDRILPPTGKFLNRFKNPYNQLSGAIANNINFLYQNGNDMGVCNIWIAQTLKYMMQTHTHHVINTDFEGDRFMSEWLIDSSKR